MKSLASTLLFLSFPLLLFTQTPLQTIRGKVIDKDTRQVLIGATVEVVDLDPPLGAVTDVDGSFVIPEVPVGRHRVVASYLGYETFVSDNVILNSAKELVLDIELLETGIVTDEVVVSARKFGSEPVNELATVSTRSFSVEETQRYAASANDPSRMALGFPGVQVSRDNRNDVTIRGNSGIGLLWRLEGVDIPNPNHFARIGSSGGGITIFSISMLGQSDFSTGAFPAVYGNALSGIFDMNFRVGNKQEREYTFRAGFLGLDFATEGPITKGKSSYLFNYRYSTLAVLSAMGIRLVDEREDNVFQDLSFKLHFTSDNNRHIFSIWGIGGLSNEDFNPVEGVENWETYNDYISHRFDTRMGAAGFNHTFLIDDQSFLKTSLALMGQKIIFRDDTLNTDQERTTISDQKYNNNRLAISSFYSRKLNVQATLKAGVTATILDYNLNREILQSDGEYFPLIEGTGNSWMLQPYAALRWRPHTRWTINGGIHALYFGLNNDFSVEPRLGVNFQVSSATSVSLGYGLHSRIVPLGNYFINVDDGKGNVTQPNANLDLMRAHHLVLGFDQMLGQSWRIRLEGYWQSLFDIPVAADPSSTFSLINAIEGYGNQALVSSGKGMNTGLDITLEKFFTAGTFLIATTSIFNSTYRPLNGETYPTQFDSGLAATFMGGKEWSVGERSVLQVGLKMIFNSGQRLTPILSPERDPLEPTQPILDESQPFSEQVDAYFRPDLRIAYRKDNPHNAWYIALDVQNFIGRKNIDALDRDYDPDLGTWVFREQSGIVPVLSFQIDW